MWTATIVIRGDDAFGGLHESASIVIPQIADLGGKVEKVGMEYIGRVSAQGNSKDEAWANLQEELLEIIRPHKGVTALILEMEQRDD